MARSLRVLSIVGARPQLIKASAVSRALASCNAVREVMVHTGQHHDEDMSDVFFRDLEIPLPAHFLDIHGGGHGEMTGRMLSALEQVIVRETPDCVLIYGDTNSTLAGALAAAKLQTPIAHVEAGMRAFNRSMPEEINRVVADHLSTLHLCPTTTAVNNLAREGITHNVFHVGDVMYDACLYAKSQATRVSDVLERFGLQHKAFALATVHRAANTDDRDKLTAILDYLKASAEVMPVVVPMHPRTQQRVTDFGLSVNSLRVVAPLGFIDMSLLLASAAQIYTDSGGVQKEAYFHRTPCVTLRSETEWVETIEAGWNRLWDGPDYRPRQDITEYGDGHAAERIVHLICGMQSKG